MTINIGKELADTLQAIAFYAFGAVAFWAFFRNMR